MSLDKRVCAKGFWRRQVAIGKLLPKNDVAKNENTIFKSKNDLLFITLKVSKYLFFYTHYILMVVLRVGRSLFIYILCGSYQSLKRPF